MDMRDWSQNKNRSMGLESNKSNYAFHMHFSRLSPNIARGWSTSIIDQGIGYTQDIKSIY